MPLSKLKDQSPSSVFHSSLGLLLERILHDDFPASERSKSVQGFKLNAQVWSFFIEPDTVDSSAAVTAWLCYFLKGREPLSSSSGDANANASGGWKSDAELSSRAQAVFDQLFRKCIGRPNAPEPKEGVCVLFKPQLGILCCVPCHELRPIANLIARWNNPPSLVIQDWRRQLASDAAVVSSAETLVHQDGLLLPLKDVIQAVEENCQTSAQIIELPFLNRFAEPPRWPGLGSDYKALTTDLPQPSDELPANMELAGANDLNLGSPAATPIHQKRNRSKKHLQVPIWGWAVAAFVLIALLWAGSYWMSTEETVASTDHSPSPTHTANPASPLSQSSRSTPDSTQLPNDVSSDDLKAELGDDDVPLTVLETEDTLSSIDITQSEPGDSLESLLSQLNPNARKANFLSRDADSIVRDALITQSPKTEPNAASNDDSPAEADDDETQETNTPTPMPDSNPTNATTNETLQATHTWSIQSASQRETVAMAQRPAPKSARCEVSLKLNEDLVVEPSEALVIENIGTQSWKIAIEEESPEIVLEIQSKPGLRWRLESKVMYRDSANSLLIPLAPGDAQRVGNQLIDYVQWLNQSIESLRAARNQPRRNTRIDLFGEIKNLEKQQREAERAIEHWKTVARLSHLFYDNHEISVQLTAKPRPPSGPTSTSPN